MFNVMDMEDGFYINDAGAGRAFGEPCLPLAAAVRSPTFKDLVEDGEGKTLETWNTIFRHLIDRAKDAEAAASTPLKNVKRYLIKLPCSIYIMLHFQKGRQNFVFLFRLLGQSKRAGAINDRYSGILIHSWMHSSLTRPGLAITHFLLDSQG